MDADTSASSTLPAWTWSTASSVIALGKRAGFWRLQSRGTGLHTDEDALARSFGDQAAAMGDSAEVLMSAVETKLRGAELRGRWMLDLSRNNQLTEYQKEAVIYLTRIFVPGWLTIRRSSPLRFHLRVASLL